MMPVWKEYSIDDLKKKGNGSIAIGPFGSRMKSDCYVKSGIPVIRGTNITGSRAFDGEFVYITKEKAKELGSANVYKGDLVFPHRGAIGEVGIVLDDKQYVISSSLMKLTCEKSIVNPLFLFYFFKTDQGKHELLKNASQVGTPGIGQPLASLKGIRIKLPELSIQNQIVDILNSFDDKIDNNNRINQTLEAMAQVLFKSWFVDFDPVKAKIEAIANGEDPQLAAMQVISGKTTEELQQMSADKLRELQHTADLFPDEMEESELGWIPKGWRISEIGKEVEINGGATPSTKETVFWEKGTNYWATPKDLSKLNDKILIDTERKITDLGVREISSGKLPLNTVLLSSRAPVGYLAISKIPISINQGFIAMVCNKKLPPEYILQWTVSVMDEIISRSTGTTFQEISKSNFRPIKILVPAKKNVLEYEKTAKRIYDSIELNIRANKSLVEIRDSFLPELITGKITL